MSSEIIIGMAGSGGDGIVAAGESLITAAAIDGYHAMMTKSFGPQIRGGESSFRIRFSTKPVLNPGEALDVAVALNWDDFLKFGGEMPIADGAVILFDSKTGVDPDDIPLKGINPSQVLSIPIEEMALENANTARAKNVIVLGLVAGWFGIGKESILSGIRKRFAKKSKEVLEGNERAYAAGIKYAEDHPLKNKDLVIDLVEKSDKLLTDGNAMCAAASLFAGLDYFGGYPITPSSEIMHLHSKNIWQFGGTMMQFEDEIAGIGGVLGASFAGAKAMTSTSGPGMALKSEIMGLATMSELPMVIVNVQRGGPSTGIPTKSEQADLYQAAFSAHGDAIRPILAPLNVSDMFGMTVEAFNIAEEYQTPVIILSDQELSQRKETFDPIDTSKFKVIDRLEPTAAELENYTRYKFTDNHISPISHPGMKGGNYLASGIEHDETGGPSSSGEIHSKMNEKRIAKFNPLKEREDLFEIIGDKDAEIGIISWGTIAGVVTESVEKANAEGMKVKFLIPKLVFPIAEKVFEDFFASVKKGLVVEQSHQGQLYHLIRMYVDVPKGVGKFCKSGSNPITPDEVLGKIKEL